MKYIVILGELNYNIYVTLDNTKIFTSKGGIGMSKFKLITAAFVLVLAMTVNAAAGQLGDVNNDGSITIDDVAIALQSCLNGIETIENGDVNGDGKLDSQDVAQILQKILDSSYSLGEEDNPSENNGIIVDRSVVESVPSSNIYKTVQEAYEAAQPGTAENPTVITIKPGVYLMNGDEANNGLSITKDYLTFIGDSDDPNDIVLADNRGNNQGSTSNYNSASVVSSCTGLTMKNISIYNYCNIDVPFEKDPSQALTKRSDLETQAFAYIGAGDKHIYENCQFISILDTMSCDARSYFNNCYVQGTNDFMGGSGTQYWYNSTINSLSNHIIGGGDKMIFDNCTFQLNKPEGSTPTYFCKGWTNVTVLNSVVPTNKGTYQWTPTLPGQYMFQYYNLVDETGAKAAVVDDSCAIELTDEQAQGYNIWNVLRGDDDWDPAGCKDTYESLGSEPMIINVNDAITVKTGDSSGTITASVYPSRADQTVTFTAEGDITIEQNGNTCTVTADNHSLEVTTAIVTVTAANGIKNKTVVTVEPKIEDAPVFTKEPEVIAPNEGVISIDYAVDLGVASSDTSLITWYRCDDENGSNPITLADTKMDEPTKTYNLCEGDIGKYIMVSISPKSELSNAGEATTIIYPVAITADMIPNRNISTDFQSVPTHPPFITSDVLSSSIDNGDGTTTLYRTILEKSITGTVPGKWNFIGDWYYNYGTGTYASLVKGIITGVRYCRTIYKQPTDDYGDMTAVVKLTPEKTAGQGFGSAGQYQEVLIKFDPDTQTGYGIRYTRSSTYTNTIEFQLYEYKDGEGTPISDIDYMTSTFRSNCIITLSLEGDTLSAKVETDYLASEDAEPVTPLELSAAITNPNSFGGFEIYHQGTTGGRYVVTGVDLIYN